MKRDSLMRAFFSSALLPFAKIVVMAGLIMMSSMMLRAETATGWVGDVPVPLTSLIETDSAVNFDSPSGRVIQFTFHIDMTAEAIAGFYEQALPELGWQKDGQTYLKGNEIMRITQGLEDAVAGMASFDVVIVPAK